MPQLHLGCLQEDALMQPEEHRVFLSELVWKLLRKVGADRYHPDDHAEEAWSGGLNHRELFSFHPLQNIDFFALSPKKRVITKEPTPFTSLSL